MTVQQKAATRKQLVADARNLAHAGKWDEAIEVNQQLIDKNEKDAEAWNRLGRARLALGRLQEARDAYTRSLKADPANLIARRNLQRLEQLRGRSEADVKISPDPMPRTNVFIEEVGKTWVDELVNPVAIERLAEVFPGERLDLVVEDGRLVVKRGDGRVLGEVEANTAKRVIELIGLGNRYEAFALGISGQSLRIILREVHREGTEAHISFPRQITSRAYLRERDQLRARDDSDFFMGDDEDDEDDAITAETEEDDAVDADNDAPLDEPLTIPEEESDGYV